MHRHPLDPPAPYRAAFPLARLIAAGLLDYPECLAVLAQAGGVGAGGVGAGGVRASGGGAGGGGAGGGEHTPSGLRTRLAHALADAVAHWALQRARASHAVRRVLAPLLAAHAPAAALLDAARAENRAHGHPLRDVELAALAKEEAARHLVRA